MWMLQGDKEFRISADNFKMFVDEIQRVWEIHGKGRVKWMNY
jgi:hypothetical protein